MVLLLHLALGLVSLFGNVFLIVWIFAFILSFLLQAEKSYVNYFIFICYIGSFEVLGRVLKCNPFIPYEFTKYFFVVASLPLLFRNARFIWLILLMLVSVFISYQICEASVQDYVFNAMGPISLAFLVAAFYKVRINDPLDKLRFIVYPIIALWVYCLINTPSIDELGLDLGANEKSTGGFGSNQVSTVFGLATFILTIRLATGRRLSSWFVLDLGILLLIFAQGLLSFSRGGIMGGVVGIAVFLLYYFRKRFSPAAMVATVFFTLALGIAFELLNQATNNLLLDRYKGKTYGTEVGVKENDLNNLTTNRYAIFLGDLDLWYSSPVYGVGIGQSRFLREEDTLSPAHVELSRLLAEQGIFGALFFLIWLWLGWQGFRNNATDIGKAMALAFFMVAVFTSFHAAMRTYVTPLLTLLAIVMYSEKSRMDSAVKIKKRIKKNVWNTRSLSAA